MAVRFDPGEFPVHMARDVELANCLPSEAHTFVEIDQLFEALEWVTLYQRARPGEIVWLWDSPHQLANKGLWRHV